MRLPLLAAITLLAPTVWAGAFIFAEDFPDAVTHPQVYSGMGGSLTDLTVCLDTSVNGSLTQQAEPAVIKAVATFNRGRSLAANNFGLNNASDIPSGRYDFESVLLHEIGHCQGLNHVNHASESGLSDPQANGTKSAPGGNGVFNQAAGSDGIHGSRDDVRGDDVNLHWYIRGQNNPGVFLATADSSTMARALNFLPAGHGFAANGDRDVMNALGFANAESVMQQGTPPREAKRNLLHDDLMTLRLARAGLNRSQGNGDDYSYQLRYVGRLNNPSNAACNVRIRIDNSTGFAVCGVSASSLGSNDNWRIVQAQVAMNNSINWYYSPGPNTTTAITSSVPNPSPVGQNYSVNVRVQEGSGITIDGNPFGTVEVSDGLGASCSFELSSAMNGQGSCQLGGSSGGSRTLTARFYGRGGFDYSEGSAAHTVSSSTPTTTTITARNPTATVVGQPYTVSVQVGASASTPTGSVSISDGSVSCSGTLASGSMSCVLSSTSAGTKTLTASYSPSGNFVASSGTASHVVSRASTSAAIVSALPDPSGFAQPVTVNFAVTALAPSTAQPSGSATISASGGSETCTATVAAGSCVITLSSVGARTLILSYPQNAGFAAASATEVHQVNPAATSINFSSGGPNPSVVGQPYSVQFNVVSPNAIPDGGVSVSDGSQSCSSLLSAGFGACQLNSLQAGVRTLTATYSSPGNFATSTATATQQVNPANTQTRILRSFPNPSAVGGSVRVDFEVLALAPGGGQPSGMVTVTAGAGETCSGSVADGFCVLTLGDAGPRSLQVQYAGAADYLTSSNNAPHSVSADIIFSSGFEAYEE